MRILITGSRNRHDWNTINEALLEATRGQSDVVIVHGDCPTGVDQMAQRWAECQGVKVERYPADWSLGKKAGPLRNQKMVDLGADLVLAFPAEDSRGTLDCMRRAQDAGIPVKVYTSEPIR